MTKLSDVNRSAPVSTTLDQVKSQNYVLNEIKLLLGREQTPFGVKRTGRQDVQLSIDPSEGLTRKRYGYFSNETRFDESLISEVEAGLRLETSATSTDEVRIRSAVAGQYISQAEAQPGLAVVFDDEDVSLDNSNKPKLDHGQVYWGAFTWDSGSKTPNNGIGLKLDPDGLEFFIRSQGKHIGDSPIPQDNFNIDAFDGSGATGEIYDPSKGYIYNFPYTWYNQGSLSSGIISQRTNSLRLFTRERVESRPSLDNPNTPIQLVVRNNGTSESMAVELGGVQYTTYGATRDQLERRQTDEIRVTTGNYISDTRTLTENAVDPSAEPGKPLISFKRDPTESKTLNLRSNEISAQITGGDVYLIVWDEYEPNTALTGEDFTNTISLNNEGKESHVLTDTQATDYTPTTAVTRGINFFPGGGGTNETSGSESVDLRIPIDATRIYTAVNAGNGADAEPFEVGIEEGY